MVGLSSISSGRKQEGDNGVMASEWPYPARGLQRSRSCCLLVAAANASPGVRLGLAECWAAVLLSACSCSEHSAFAFGGVALSRLRQSDSTLSCCAGCRSHRRAGTKRAQHLMALVKMQRANAQRQHVGAPPRMQKQGQACGLWPLPCSVVSLFRLPRRELAESRRRRPYFKPRKPVVLEDYRRGWQR